MSYKIIKNKSILSSPSQDVSTLEEGNKIAEVLISSLKENNNAGLGLSAPQLGIRKNVCVVWANKNKEPLVLINPVIKNFSDNRIFYREGCLSIPGKIQNTVRHIQVTVSALNHENELTFGISTVPQEEVINGKYFENIDLLEAVVVQHEIDHLNGILMTHPSRKFIFPVVKQFSKPGRNDKVIIKNRTDGATQRLKFKLAEPLLSQGWDII